MRKFLSVLPQYLLPQRALTCLAGWLANSERPWLKNYLIRYFINRYAVNMHEAIQTNPFDYASFNYFFTRKLKPELRPIAPEPAIASPVDGVVSQIGQIKQGALFQAKGFYFSLATLLGGCEKHAKLFNNGYFSTLYLSPKDYHRVHMPITGKLRESIFIPGKLFSVSQKAAEAVPNLFARNERLVCIFDTDIGPMAVILVGAMIVGSINTVWYANTTAKDITVESYGGSIQLNRGDEIGSFKLGSTVIVLFAKDKIEWDALLQENSAIKMGQAMGNIRSGAQNTED